jgi:hypothetical protein
VAGAGHAILPPILARGIHAPIEVRDHEPVGGLRGAPKQESGRLLAEENCSRPRGGLTVHAGNIYRPTPAVGSTRRLSMPIKRHRSSGCLRYEMRVMGGTRHEGFAAWHQARMDPARNFSTFMVPILLFFGIWVGGLDDEESCGIFHYQTYDREYRMARTPNRPCSCSGISMSEGSSSGRDRWKRSGRRNDVPDQATSAETRSRLA